MSRMDHDTTGEHAIEQPMRAPASDIGETGIGRYRSWLADRHGLAFDDYDALWRWSVREPERFWASIWEHYEVRAHRGYERVLDSARMPGARVKSSRNIAVSSRRARFAPRHRCGPGPPNPT